MTTDGRRSFKNCSRLLRALKYKDILLQFVNDISTIVLQDQILDLGEKVNRRPRSVNGERKLVLSNDLLSIIFFKNV